MALSVTYQMLKDAAQAAKSKAEDLKNRPLLDAIIALQSLAFELQAESADVKRELDELKREREDVLEFREGVYWSDDPKNPGPFCPTCYGLNSKRVPIQKDGNRFRHCYACKTDVEVPGAEEVQPSRIRDTMGYTR